jgi:hypothetical protein
MDLDERMYTVLNLMAFASLVDYIFMINLSFGGWVCTGVVGWK